MFVLFRGSFVSNTNMAELLKSTEKQEKVSLETANGTEFDEIDIYIHSWFNTIPLFLFPSKVMQ